MNEVSRRSFVAGALAAAALGARSQTESTALQRKVQSLPSGSLEERRKKALLEWSIEDHTSAVSAGLDEDAAAMLEDIEALMDRRLGKAAPMNPALFPRIATAQGNPWLDKITKQIRMLVAADQRYPRGTNPDAKQLGIKYGYPYIQLGTEGSMLAQAFGNPHSSFFGDPVLIAPMMRRFTASYEILRPGSKHLADFGVSPHISEMYALLKESFPDLIMPSRQRAWEQALTANCEAFLKEPAQVFTEPGMPSDTLEEVFRHHGRGDCYPNAQSHLMLALLMTGIALKNDRYLDVADKGVDLMRTAFYPDGGTAYIDVQNECFTYHGIMIEDLARYWQVTGNREALELVKASRWYYPLSITPQNVAEYSSAPCWKHYWNAVKGTSTASIVASLTDCGYNAKVGGNDEPSANWLAATLYKPVPAEKWWDSAMFYDRNIEGPRGRFGQYSYCGTARNTLDARRGKLTYVGNLWVERSDLGRRELRGWPINCGVDGAWAEVRLNTKPETVNRWDTHACLSRDEQTASLASAEFGSVTSRYRLAQYNQDPIAVRGQQQWLLTPRRMVGLISVEALDVVELYSMGIALKMVSGRGTSGIRKEWMPKERNVYEYGGMTIRLWPQGDPRMDLVGIGHATTAYTDTFSGNTGMCGLLTLSDPKSAVVRQATKSQFAKGTRYHALVEIYPTEYGGAKAVRIISNGNGLTGLELAEKEQFLQMVCNPSETAIKYAPPNQEAIVHRSGEKQRLSFLPAVESIAPTPVEGIMSIPSGQHIVLRTT